MVRPKEFQRKSFSAFQSAREEADRKAVNQSWDNEGGHVNSTGRIVGTPNSEMPYKVILQQAAIATSSSCLAMTALGRSRHKR